MNKKVMAIAMAAVMLMVAVTVGVSVQSDAEEELGTNSNPREIFGHKEGGVITYYELYPNETLNATIAFNRAAFSTKAIPSLTYTIANEVEGVTVNTSPSSVNSQFDGIYTVQFIGTAVNDGATITFTLTVQDYVCSESNHQDAENHTAGCIRLPVQTFYYVAYVKVIGDESTFLFNNSSTASKSINYNETVSVETKMTNGPENVKYSFYATGLPKGISMTVEGVMGGKLSGTYEPTDGDLNTEGTQVTTTVYAVSDYGVVKSTTFTWTIGNPISNTGFITIDGNIITGDTTGETIDITTKKYIAIQERDTIKLDIGASTGYSIKEDSLSVIGYDGLTSITKSEDGTYDVPAATGTGTYKLSITATLQGTGVRDEIVTEYVTVYVVGNIVDADLKPTVSSRTA